MKGRNAPCPCGSGKKYKLCCLRHGTPAVEPPDDALRHSQLAVTLIGMQRYAEAIASCRRALQLDPALVATQNNLGIALKNLGRLDEAVVAYRAALELDAEYAPAHHNLGDVLYRQGRTDAARACFEAALALDPGLSQAQLELGNVLADLGELDEAIRHYRGVIAARWNLPGAYASLGMALSWVGKREESRQCFERAALLAPASAEAHFNLARALLENHDAVAAIASIQRALVIKPVFAEAQGLYGAALWCQGKFDEAVAHCRQGSAAEQSLSQTYNDLGNQLLRYGLHTGALACFERCLEMEPDQPVVRHFIAALRNGNPEHPAADYVEKVFDAYADTFDEHLLGTLRYTVPRALAELSADLARRRGPWDVLDLGCGTGLFGAAMSPRPRSLVGVDLSARMLERARARGLYDRLEQADLLAALERKPAATFDLIAAADVFIYVGKLDDVVPQIGRLLRPGGLFVFSVEAAGSGAGESPPVGDAGYRLTATGRYVHEIDYLDRLAVRNRFNVRHMAKVPLRLEHARAVLGWLVAWEASEATVP